MQLQGISKPLTIEHYSEQKIESLLTDGEKSEHYPENQSEEQIRKKLKRFVQIFGDKKDWHLSGGKWTRNHLSTVFYCLQKVEVHSIDLSTNKVGNFMIKSLTNPFQYSNLVTLNLKNNNISSIQSLEHSNFKALKWAIFSDNNVVKVNALKKMSAPNLASICFYANRIVEGKEMTKHSWESKNLQSLTLGLNCLSEISWVNKVSCFIADSSLQEEPPQKLIIQNNRLIPQNVKTLMKHLKIKSCQIYC